MAAFEVFTEAHEGRSLAANRARVTTTLRGFEGIVLPTGRSYLPTGFGIVGVPFATALAFFFAFFSLVESFGPLFCFLGDLSAMSVHLRPARLVWPPKRMREPIGGGHPDIRIAQ